jgi:hypothetical protein
VLLTRPFHQTISLLPFHQEDPPNLS